MSVLSSHILVCAVERARNDKGISRCYLQLLNGLRAPLFTTSVLSKFYGPLVRFCYITELFVSLGVLQ